MVVETSTYSVKDVATATSYTWTVPAGFSVVQNNGRSAILACPHHSVRLKISVRANNGLWIRYQQKRNTLRSCSQSILFYKGPTAVTAGQSGVTYSLPAAANITFTWTVPVGSKHHQRTRHQPHPRKVLEARAEMLVWW